MYPDYLLAKPSELTQSFIVISLLSGDIKTSMDLLHNRDNNSSYMSGVKCLYIDISSFIEELIRIESLFNMKNDDLDVNQINSFLLQTYNARKVLKKTFNKFKKLRNQIYAHGYRIKKGGGFVNPLDLLMGNYETAPISNKQIAIFAEICLMIADILQDCFRFEDNKAYSYMKLSLMKFEMELQTKNEHEILPQDFASNLIRDANTIKDALRNNDNYQIIARRLKCTLVK